MLSDILTQHIMTEVRKDRDFVWDPRTGKYISATTAREIAQYRVIRGVEDFIDDSRRNIRKLTQDLLGQKINVADWQRAMAREIKESHVASYVAGRGGKQIITQADYGRMGGMLRWRQYRYLNEFAEQIANGELSPAQIQMRAEMYAGQARSFHYEGYRQAGLAAGFREERWVVDPAKENCPDCLENQSRGWVSFGSFPVPPGGGATRCLTNCGCHLEFR